eukprot:TRINITY_DN5847_c0_g1_i3.p1 TRINITY_DN5847_c0_g1~~TRINITY_DN5847_c0_g1_i3.p1  ORF type:complete len:292 (-),score=63.89 TRINITY_DN5847_c0_g1_i3:81-956(-)
MKQFQYLKQRPQQSKSHPPPPPKPTKIPGVQHIIAVSSGKGGVGKSTVAVNLALAFEKMNLKTGLLDTDIYGPSVPIMMNLKSQRALANEANFLIPLRNYNISCMSIGFMVPEDKPVVWRGPLVMGALQQMLKQVVWGDLDVLVLDLPPGTGDTQLTLAQTAPLSGAVIVSTPQDLALADVIRGANMFKLVDVPLLGIIENMSYYHCPNCAHEDHIFGDSGAPKLADQLEIDFLGKIPLNKTIRETTDEGKPIVVSNPNSPLAQIYIQIAKKIYTKLQQQEPQPQPQPQAS